MAQDANPDKALRDDLNRHLDEEAALIDRAEQISNYAAGLLEKGQEDYPWTPEHIEEALQNAPDPARAIAWSYLKDAIETHLVNGKKNYQALTMLREIIHLYWMQMAIIDAEEHFAHSWE